MKRNIKKIACCPSMETLVEHEMVKIRGGVSHGWHGGIRTARTPRERDVFDPDEH